MRGVSRLSARLKNVKKILIVEDEKDIQEILSEFLKDAGYEVTIAPDGVEAVMAFQEAVFNLVLLDIMIPKIDGYGVCELIRKTSSVPIIMLTALDDEEAQVKGFDLAIDDYVTKPFSVQILLRKIAAILRRTSGVASNSQLKFGDVVLDVENYKVYKCAREVNLTQKEFEILRELLSHQGKVLTRQMLLNSLWNYDFYGDDRVVDTHIKNIRKKLEVSFIETIRGVGYRIDKVD